MINREPQDGRNFLDERAIMTRVMSISEPWYIKNIEFDQTKKEVLVKVDFIKGSKFSLHSNISNKEDSYKVFDTRTKVVRHFNYAQYPLYLEVRVPRIKISDNKIKLLTPPWFGHVSGFTLEYEANILKMAQSMPIRSLSSIILVTIDKIWRVIDIYIEKARELEDYSDVIAVGMDETSRRKHHKYITMFVDLKKNEP